MTSQQIDSFLTFLRNCEQRYHMAEADELEANAITNDIHHSLESSGFTNWQLEVQSDGEVLALGLELASIRRKRRAAKDILSETAPVLAWMEENRAVIKGLEQLLGEVRKAERAVENRIYTPRRKKT